MQYQAETGDKAGWVVAKREVEGGGFDSSTDIPLGANSNKSIIAKGQDVGGGIDSDRRS